MDEQPQPTHRYILESNSIQPCLSSENTSVEYQQRRYRVLYASTSPHVKGEQRILQRLSQTMQAILQSTLGKVSTDRQKDIGIVGGEAKSTSSVYLDRRGATSTNSDPRGKKP